MRLSLYSSLSLIQKQVCLQTLIQTHELLSIHPTAIDLLISAIQLDPKRAERELSKVKYDREPQGKIRAILSSLCPEGTNETSGKGIVLSPKLTALENLVKREANIVYTPDVIYTGRKNEKPELSYAPHLVEKPELKLLTVRGYPEAEKLLRFLIREREWLTETLRGFYVELGNKQREFLYSSVPTDLHVFDTIDASKRAGLSISTISRLRKGRYVAVIGNEKEEQIYPVTHLMPNKDNYFRILTINKINKILFEEGKNLQGWSDEELASRMSASRRTVTKYRIQAQIPNSRKRTKAYSVNPLAKYSIPFF